MPATTSRSLPAGVTLRLLHPDDGPALAAAYTRNRAHLEPWEPARPPDFYDADRQAELVATELRSHDDGRSVPFVLERDGRIVGRVNLSDIVLGAFRNTHLGYWVDASLAGRGVMTAAVDAACAHARDDLGLHRVTAGCFAANAASWRVMEKLGMRREQHGVQDSWHAELGWLDGYTYAVLRSEWTATP